MDSFFDAFISYGRADSKAFATKLHTRLVEQGLRVWFDQNDIPLGVDFQEQIYDGIEKSHNFLFIIAPHSGQENPIEAVWLALKNRLRRCYRFCKNFSIMKRLFKLLVELKLFNFPNLQKYDAFSCLV
jgi:transposase